MCIRDSDPLVQYTGIISPPFVAEDVASQVSALLQTESETRFTAQNISLPSR